MLAPHAVDTAVIISSLIASLCFTFVEPFDDIFFFVKSSCALVSWNTNKSLRPNEGRSDRLSERPSEWIRASSLNSYFTFCKIVVKKLIKLMVVDFAKHFNKKINERKVTWRFDSLRSRREWVPTRTSVLSASAKSRAGREKNGEELFV